MIPKAEYEAYEIGIQDQRRQNHRDNLESLREIEKLKTENASLWALAKFGRKMLSARNLSPIPLSGEQTYGLRAVINDLAELCDLLKIDPNSETLVETSLSQLPEKRE